MAFSRITLVTRIRHILNDNPFADICTEAMDTTETGLDVADTTKYEVGCMVEFQDDGEQCYVTALPSGTTLTVIRGYNSAAPGTGTSHNISTAIVRDPVFQFVQITDAVESVLRSFWPYVYKEVPLTLTPNTDGNKWYNVTNGDTTGEMMELSSAVQLVGTGATSTVFRYGERGDVYPIFLMNNLPTAKVTSGQGIYIPFIRDATNSILVTGIGRLTATFSTPNYTDIEDGVQVDCVTYYAVARLVAESDITRSTQEDTTMGDQTVVPGRRTEIASFWEAKGLEKRHQWQEELRIKTPRMVYYNRGGRNARSRV
jgi:hypothetical protein